MKISVIGAGYVGLSIAVLLSQKQEVVILEIDKKKIISINKKEKVFKDDLLEEYLQFSSIKATECKNEALEDAEFIIVCTPTNYDEAIKCFDTSFVEDAIQTIRQINKTASIIIKSTVPVGFTDRMIRKFEFLNIFFSPEFLREGSALYDNLYPSRIIVGGQIDKAKQFAGLLEECSLKENVPVLLTHNSEAESIKLFSNTYLALRIAFFNELDTYAELNDLNTQEIIEGLGFDHRIGNYYNNPSFGYGGYCLPKDTKQLLANYKQVPQNLMEAIVDSNMTRKKHIVKMIVSRNPKVVGIYRLVMKKQSDNFRNSATIEIINLLSEFHPKVIIYEPLLHEVNFLQCDVYQSLEEFKKESDIIVANRMNSELFDVENKIYTRDLFERD